MIRIREASARVCRFLFWRNAGSHVANDELEKIAEWVMDYSRMRSDENPAGIVFVEVGELAFRLREDPRVVRKALNLLERDGRAQRQSSGGFGSCARVLEVLNRKGICCPTNGQASCVKNHLSCARNQLPAA